MALLCSEIYLLLRIFRNKHYNSPGLERTWLGKELGQGKRKWNKHVIQSSYFTTRDRCTAAQYKYFEFKICLNTRWIALQNYSYLPIFFQISTLKKYEYKLYKLARKNRVMLFGTNQTKLNAFRDFLEWTWIRNVLTKL